MARLESTKRAKLKTAKQHQPSQKSKSLTCCYILTTSFLGYPLPRSHRHGGFEKKMFPSTSYSFLFQIKAVAHMIDRSANMYRSICNIHVCMHIYIQYDMCSIKFLCQMSLASPPQILRWSITTSPRHPGKSFWTSFLLEFGKTGKKEFMVLFLAGIE